MKHWGFHFVLRAVVICASFFLLLFLFSEDGSNDAMGNAMAAAFAILAAYTISLVGTLVFLGIEGTRLRRKKETAKATCNLILIGLMLLVPMLLIF